MVFMDGYRIFESDLSLPSHMTITQKHNAPQDVYMHSPAWCGSSLTEDAGIIHRHTHNRGKWDEQWYINNVRVFNTCEIKVQQTTHVSAPLRSIILWCSTNYDPCTHDQTLKEARAPVKGVPQHIIQCQQCPWSLYPLEVIRFSARQSQIHGLQVMLISGLPSLSQCHVMSSLSQCP